MLGCRLMVGLWVLVPAIGVRISAPQPNLLHLIVPIKILFKLLKLILFFILYFFISGVVTFLLLVIIGLFGTFTIHIPVLVGILLVTCLFAFVFKFSKSKLFIASVLFFATTELVLFLLSPVHSLIPEQILLKMGVISTISSTNFCNQLKEIELAAAFVEPSIDTSETKLFYGGGTLFPQNAPDFLKPFFPPSEALTFGNVVYLSPSSDCVYSDVIVHEFVHTWQFGNRVGVGLRGVPKVIKYIYQYFTNFNGLYIFGGRDGLEEAKSAGMTFRDFGAEQQATIVQTYYIFHQLFIKQPYLYSEQNKYYILLKYFVDQEFVFNKKVLQEVNP